jgi:Icc-related predicted phosphoesterase/ribosomal protein S14
LTRILAISDLHQGTAVAPPLGTRVVTQEQLIEKLIAREPDVIMIAGDLQDHMWNSGDSNSSVTSVKKAILADRVIKSLNEADMPVYFVWGNTDIMDNEKEKLETPITDDIRQWFTDEFTNFHDCHKQVLSLDEFTIVGYQDANKTDPLSAGRCWEEPEIHHELRPIIEKLTKKQRDQLILLTHVPPRGILDFSSLGSRHIGSFYLRELIDDFQPKLAMFGHVHYLGGYSLYCGRTQCVNISSFGLAVSHEILFGQSAFEIVLEPNSEEIPTTMIVSHYWKGKKRQDFVEYRTCQGCGRHAPFARPQFKYCRICLSKRRLQNQVAVIED